MRYLQSTSSRECGSKPRGGHAVSRGVTIAELVIAVGLFSVLAVILGGLFLSVSRLQRQALRDARIVDNTRYAIETMSRTLRTVPSSAISSPTGDSPSGATSVTFAHTGKLGGLDCQTANPCFITYRRDATLGQLFEQNGSAAGTGADLPLTADAVEVTDFQIYFSGRAAGDFAQPLATITLAVRDRTESANRPPLRVQTTVSLRPLDLE